ncbi:sperm acrosome developmental regulator [Marmota monax]|uniref:Uncharacterized protein n=1 Tax=Marmota monax TaxID=9995 RepID=A0A5E4CQE0_MARMO|nr:sperm acrosome developmental regulator [Marmota monax]KAF7477495.1 uncharacterized protein GHT09_011416 [Marmota monax]VTJ83996.1 Hypothetical predicted protein [Marmota monax]
MMAVIMRFIFWIRRVWQRMTCWVLQWRRRAKLIILEPTDSKKQEIKGVEETTELDTVKLIEPPKEAKVTTLEEHPEVAEAYVLAKTMDETVDETELELGPEPRSLLRLPQTAVQAVSTLMLSALQSGWQMCRWKSSVSSTSVTSQLRRQSPLETPEAEMLREVYLVLWAIRKQLRELACRQERCRRHHIRTHSSSQLESVQGLKQVARSPL